MVVMATMVPSSSHTAMCVVQLSAACGSVIAERRQSSCVGPSQRARERHVPVGVGRRPRSVVCHLPHHICGSRRRRERAGCLQRMRAAAHVDGCENARLAVAASRLPIARRPWPLRRRRCSRRSHPDRNRAIRTAPSGRAFRSACPSGSSSRRLDKAARAAALAQVNARAFRILPQHRRRNRRPSRSCTSPAASPRFASATLGAATSVSGRRPQRPCISARPATADGMTKDKRTMDVGIASTSGQANKSAAILPVSLKRLASSAAGAVGPKSTVSARACPAR